MRPAPPPLPITRERTGCQWRTSTATARTTSSIWHGRNRQRRPLVVQHWPVPSRRAIWGADQSSSGSPQIAWAFFLRMISAAASASAFSLRCKSFFNCLISLRSLLPGLHWPAGTPRASPQPARRTAPCRGSTQQVLLRSYVPFSTCWSPLKLTQLAWLTLLQSSTNRRSMNPIFRRLDN
jgi:hypothetical protein